MSKPKFESAYIAYNPFDKKTTMSIELEISGKRVNLRGVPASNELIQELTALFKRHLPKEKDLV